MTNPLDIKYTIDGKILRRGQYMGDASQAGGVVAIKVGKMSAFERFSLKTGKSLARKGSWILTRDSIDAIKLEQRKTKQARIEKTHD